MNRRCAAILVATIALLPFDVAAQPTARTHRIGFLGTTSAADYSDNLEAFRQGLRELGYEEGRNIVIDFRWADGRDDRLQDLAVQLVRLKPDVLVSHAAGVAAAQRATATIPIVMGVSADPVGTGLIKSLAKPGGNTTGIASQITDLASKRLELLKEALPTIRDVAVLSNPAVAGSRKGLEQTEIAARVLGVRIRSFPLPADADALESVFARMLRERPDGLVVLPDPIASRHGSLIAAFAIRNRLPAVAGDRPFAHKGGLLAYGSDFTQGWRSAARYVDRILKGAKPADLPVEQPTTFQLTVNLETARAIGLTLPASFLERATEVLQ